MLLKKWIYVSPQDTNQPATTEGRLWNSAQIREVIEYALANFPVNPNKVYLTGLSTGGAGVLEYLAEYVTDPKVTKAVATSAFMNQKFGEDSRYIKDKYIQSASSVPLWLTIAHDDQHSPVQNVIDVANAQPSTTLLTVFADGLSGNPHGNFASVYRSELNMPLYAGTLGNMVNTPFDRTIYDWFESD